MFALLAVCVLAAPRSLGEGVSSYYGLDLCLLPLNLVSFYYFVNLGGFGIFMMVLLADCPVVTGTCAPLSAASSGSLSYLGYPPSENQGS